MTNVGSNTVYDKFVPADWVPLRADPERDTVLAVGSLLAFWPVYYLNSTQSSPVLDALWIVGIVGLCVLAPAYYVVRHRGKGFAAVGLTTVGWHRALLVSGILAGVFGLEFFFEPPVSTSALAIHIATVAVMFWEPFFVYGWLQLRFERAFGTAAGIILAAAGFALFHVGVLGMAGLAGVVVIGIFQGVLFWYFDRSILVLWPLYWAIASTQGTIDREVFSVGDLLLHALALGLTGAGLLWLARNRRNGDQSEQRH